MSDALIFSAVRKIVRRHSKNPLEGLIQQDVDELNEALKQARTAPPEGQGTQTADKPLSTQDGVPAAKFKASDKGIALIHSFEQCKLEPYRDPGSSNGLPITAGWGTTVDEDGGPIPLGVAWTQEKADRLFRRDIASREKRLNDALAGVPTTQAQFDAMLSLGYNIGMAALIGSTVMRRHKSGDHEGAATAFGLWNKNDGRVLRGLVRRRAAEAELYRGKS